MLDKEKDKRLSYLLDQTDAHLQHMSDLIRLHQVEEAQKSGADFPVGVRLVGFLCAIKYGRVGGELKS